MFFLSDCTSKDRSTSYFERAKAFLAEELYLNFTTKLAHGAPVALSLEDLVPITHKESLDIAVEDIRAMLPFVFHSLVASRPSSRGNDMYTIGIEFKALQYLAAFDKYSVTSPDAETSEILSSINSLLKLNGIDYFFVIKSDSQTFSKMTLSSHLTQMGVKDHTPSMAALSEFETKIKTLLPTMMQGDVVIRESSRSTAQGTYYTIDVSNFAAKALYALSLEHIVVVDKKKKLFSSPVY